MPDNFIVIKYDRHQTSSDFPDKIAFDTCSFAIAQNLQQGQFVTGELVRNKTHWVLAVFLLLSTNYTNSAYLTIDGLVKSTQGHPRTSNTLFTKPLHFTIFVSY